MSNDDHYIYLPDATIQRSSSDLLAARPTPTVAKLAFILTGATTLLPWQCFITSLDFFMLAMPDKQMQYLVPNVNMGVLLLITIVLLRYASLTSATSRVYVPGVLIIPCILAVPIACYGIVLRRDAPSAPLSSSEVDLLFAVSLASLALSACFSMVMQGSLYGLAGQISLRSDLTGMGETGKGVAGILIVVARVITKLACHNTLAGEALSTLIFFACATVVVVVSLLAFSATMRSPVIRARLARATGSESVQEGGEDEAPGNDDKLSICAVFKKVWRQALAAGAVFTTCIACFPGLTSSLKSTTWGLGDWYPVLMIASYNVGDQIGKAAPDALYSFFQVGKRAKWLPAAAAAHTVFVPAFVLLYLDEGAVHDVVPLLLVFALGLTTGYLGCEAMRLGPEQVEHGPDKQTAGIVDSFALILGLTAGSVIGLILGATLPS